MLFSTFAKYLYQLEQQSSRLAMTAKLAELFALLKNDIQHPTEIRLACYLMQGSLVPSYQSLEFSLSVKMVLKVLGRLEQKKQHSKNSVTPSQEQSDLFGQNLEIDNNVVGQKYKALGDLGLVAEEILSTTATPSSSALSSSTPTTPSLPITASSLFSAKTSSLSIAQVHSSLVDIAKDNGFGSQERKNLSLQELLEQLDPLSAKYVVRVVIGKLRLGFSTMTILDALSWTVANDKSWTGKLEIAWQKKADIGLLAESFLLANSLEAKEQVLKDYQAELGVPIVPALCQRLDSYAQMVEKLGEMYAEPKYDGLRVQIHFSAGKAKAYTRNLEDATHMFPELQTVAKDIGQDCILDSEAIGIDPNSQKLMSFQTTITRKRKHHIGEQAKAVPIKFFVFDLLFVGNKSMIDQPLFVRRAKLDELFTNNHILEKTQFIKTANASQLANYHAKQLATGLEGAVMKKADSLYRSGRKGWRWVKIKEEAGSRGKLSDTLDLIVLGYYFGRGKRTTFGLGALLVGTIDNGGAVEGDSHQNTVGQIKTIAKIGTGLSDEQLAELKNRCAKIKATNKPMSYLVPKELTPDVWVEPSLVVEIAADEITQSPMHSAGVALRFPRLIKFRDDKSWEQATGLDEIMEMMR